MYTFAQDLNMTMAARAGWGVPGCSIRDERAGRREFVRQTALFGYCDRRDFLRDVHRFQLTGRQFRLFLLELGEDRRPADFHQVSARTQLCGTLDRLLPDRYCLVDEQLGRYILLVFSQRSEPMSEVLLHQALFACCEENQLPFRIISSPAFQSFEGITSAYSSARRRESRDAAGAEGPNGRPAVVEQILAYLRANYSKNITLTEISGLVHMNASYVSRLLSERTGRTFSQHLLDIRLEQAKRLLLDTSLKSREIAERVGFENAKYFSHVFTKAAGMPPMKYRYGGRGMRRDGDAGARAL